MKELFSKSEAIKIATIDGNVLSNDPKKYAKQNAEAYYLILNTWAFQLYDKAYNPLVFSKVFTSWCNSYGLISAIKMAQNDSECLLSGKTETEDRPSSLFYQVILTSTDEAEDLFKAASMLQVLRYPKRFSPLCADKIEAESLAKFVQVDHRNMMIDRSGDTPDVILQDAKAILRTILRRFKATDDIYFSNGVSKDASKDHAAKLLRVLYHDPLAYYGHFMDCDYSLYEGDQYLSCPYQDKDVEPEAVPKSHKAARIIAPETAYRGMRAQQVRFGLEACILRSKYSQYINTRDQEFQRERARQASITGKLATIDMSSASDTVRKKLFRELFPEDVIKAVEQYVPTGFIYHGRRKMMSMLASAGNPVTFVCETLTFFAVAYSATKFVERWTGEKLEIPSSFGDDLIVDTRAVETVIEFLNRCGFIVNTEKSYYSTEFLYREACGVEYWKGIDMSSDYFPRDPIHNMNFSNEGYDNDSADSLAAVIQLQHRLFKNANCSEFLVNFVRSKFPRMTSHTPGVDCVDLWEDVPFFSWDIAPIDNRKEDLKKYKTPYTGKLMYQDLAAFSMMNKEPWLYRQVHFSLTDEIASDSNLSETPAWVSLYKHDIDLYHDHIDYANIKAGKNRNLAEEMCSVWENYRYYEFLRTGPLYASELDRLLKVSTPRPTISQISGKRKTHWKRSQE